MNDIKSYLSVHSEALQLRNQRNEVIASNIANAATPHFKARDIDFDAEFSKKLDLQGPLRTKDERHLSTLSSVGPNSMKYRDPINKSLDGNTVEMSVEQMEFAENVSRYQTSLTFLNNRIIGLKSAIKGE